MADLERVAIKTAQKLDEILSLLNQPKAEGGDVAAMLQAISERLTALEASVSKLQPVSTGKK